MAGRKACRAGAPAGAGVHAGVPLTYAVVAVLLMAIAAVASFAPARRAARVDPKRALRQE